tara:strand:+ start:160 stop:615 length:456 start_codon:yes stop_codon:yes gene_type:complete
MPPRQAKSLLTRKQSGDDWGMGDDDDMFGTSIMDMDPDSPEFAAAMAAETEAGPPVIPGEPDSSGFSPDFTDSGQQTATDQPLSMEEIIYDQTGPDAPPDDEVPGVKGWKNKLASYNQRGKGKGQFASGKSTAMNPVLRRGIEAKRTLITG